ncbi:MarR family transcriptional regulator [Zafaria cholistanensis]|uniref:MarR family transcriptional regulator n=1 Tax=Zafaria cholistanensis TaxID=1682741 RepID=A0A5A7NVP7_9MICC|nr:MarR family transcriptional regulator [Zafaria cholistanensis]GER24251.1 MarR family transcriptional regulator [Zafaria cholistanensis]
MTSDATPDLGNLFHAAFRGLRRGWMEQLSPWGLTPHQWRALQAAGHHDTGLHDAGPHDAGNPGGGLRLKELAERLRIAPRSATEVVDQLEAKGLVVRRPDPADRRATHVFLTPAGRRLHAEVSAARREQSERYFAALSPADRTELARLLGLLQATGTPE